MQLDAINALITKTGKNRPAATTLDEARAAWNEIMTTGEYAGAYGLRRLEHRIEVEGNDLVLYAGTHRMGLASADVTELDRAYLDLGKTITPEEARTIPGEVDVTDGGDGAKWGVADFYEEAETKLRELIATGHDFQTQWWGVKKEIRSGRAGRTGGRLWGEASGEMDEGWELIDDAYYAIEEKLPEDVRAKMTAALEGADSLYEAFRKVVETGDSEDEMLMYLLQDGYVSSHCDGGRVYAKEDSLEGLQDALRESEEEADQALKRGFGEVKTSVFAMLTGEWKDHLDED